MTFKNKAKDSVVDSFLDHLSFEVDFYSNIAGSESFEVLSFPDEQGTYPTAEETKHFFDYCESKKIVPLIKISYSEHEVVLAPNGRQGILPVGLHGSDC